MSNRSHHSTISPSRSFTDDGDDQPGSTSHDHLGLPPLCANRRTRRGLMDDEEPTMSDILGRNSRTRTICGLQVKTPNSSRDGTRGWTFPGSIDSGDSTVTPIISPTASTSTHTSCATSAASNNTNPNWTLETKLARSNERRKRVEGRFQRERSKRRSTEEDRDHVLDFMREILLGLKEEEKAIDDRSNRNSNSNSKRGKSLNDKRKGNPDRDNTLRTTSSICEFLSQYDGQFQGQNDDVCTSTNDIDEVDENFHHSPNLDSNSKQQGEPSPSKGEGDSSHKLRSLQQHWNDTQQDEPSRSRSRSISPGEYSSDSSYDTTEAEDEFPELPVTFRTLRELKSNEDKDDDEEDEDDISSLSITEIEIRDRDLRHAEEVERHSEELENLHRLFEESRQEHYAEISSMERQTRNERLQREDLLERALRYAEQLETSNNEKSKQLSAKEAAVEQCAYEHFEKVEAIRKHHRDGLRMHKEELVESAVCHAKELELRNERHKEELENQRQHIIEKFTIRYSNELQTLQDHHKDVLSNMRNLALEESNVLHAVELEALTQHHERDLADLENIHENELLLHAHKQQQQQQDKDEEQNQQQNLQNDKMLLELRERDATIERLETEGVREDEELQKIQETLAAYESKIETFEKEETNKRKELRQVRDSLNVSNHRVKKLELEDKLQQAATKCIASATSAATASTTKIVRELQEALRERDACIQELEEDLDQAMQGRQSAEPESKSNGQTVTKLQEKLVERFQFENEHAQALLEVERRLGEKERRHAEEISTLHKSMQQRETSINQARSKDSLELQRLKNGLEEIETQHLEELQFALRAKDYVLVNLETSHTEEMRNARNELHETKEQHAEDIAVLLSKMNVLHTLSEDRTESTAQMPEIFEEESSPAPRENIELKTIGSTHLRTTGNEYDVAIAYNQAGYQSRMLEDSLKRKKQKAKCPKWISSLAQTAIEKPNAGSPSILKDCNTQATVATTPPSSCSSMTSLGNDDRSVSTLGSRQSVSTLGSRNSLLPRSKNTICRGVTRTLSGSSDRQSDSLSSSADNPSVTKQKPQVSRWSRMRG